MTQEAKVAFLYPGQGLPTKDVVACYQKLKNIDLKKVSDRLSFTQEIVNKVNGSASFNIAAALQDEQSPSFQETAFVQPVVYALNILTLEIGEAMLDVLGTSRITPSFMAGHSLGEYSALTSAKVFSFEEGIDIVAHRGRFMQEACDRTPTKLVSINGLTQDKVQEICTQAGAKIAEIALINAPTLIVVGCHEERVPDIEQLTKDAGARRTTIFQTAGAFHTSYMQEAAFQLDQLLSKYSFNNPEVPVIANLTGEQSEKGEALRNHVIKGMVNPVQWAKSLATLQSLGVQYFGEVGPGTSLKSLNRLNNINDDQTINFLDLFN